MMDAPIKPIEERFEYQWTIPDIVQLKKSNESISSPVFAALDRGQWMWRLNLTMMKNAPGNPIFITLKLMSTMRKTTKEILINCEIFILNREYLLVQYVQIPQEKFKVGDSADTWLIDYDDLIDRKPYFLVDEQLTIVCTFKRQIVIGHPLEAGDVKLVSASGQEFLAHKKILANASSEFQKIFKQNENNQKENTIDVVELKDVPAVHLAIMLRYMYTIKVPIALPDIAKELIPLTDKYKLPGLKLLCEQSLFKSIGVENMFEYLEFADEHKADKLKEYILRFIGKNRMDVVESLEFAKYSPHLRQDILKEIFRELSMTVEY